MAGPAAEARSYNRPARAPLAQRQRRAPNARTDPQPHPAPSGAEKVTSRTDLSAGRGGGAAKRRGEIPALRVIHTHYDSLQKNKKAALYRRKKGYYLHKGDIEEDKLAFF